MIYPALEGAEYKLWSVFIDDCGGQHVVRPYVRARGYQRIKEIPPDQRESVMAGIKWDLSNPNSRFRPRS